MKIVDCAQGTTEWYRCRVGHVTASRVADIIARTKTGAAASRANYMAELVVGRLIGNPAESYTNTAMQWGIDTEAEARSVYEFLHHSVMPVGFVLHPTIEMAGCSPDGLVGDDGLLELKCPNSATHIDTLMSHAVPSKYITQMQFQMAVTGRSWCDFVSYDPRMPDNLRMFVRRVERDNAVIEGLENAVRAFLFELDAKVDALRKVAA
jgi:putative phage-type endonuclease